MKGIEFNEFFEITVKKDNNGFKAGDKVYFKDTVEIVSLSKLPKILNDNQVQEAREMYKQGKSYREIAKRFNVSHMTIYRALT